MALPQFLLNLLFPPRCPFCDRPVEAVVSAPCPHCLGSDVWLEGAQAVVTGEAFARCVCAGWYREPLRASLRRFKFSGRRDYAKAYGPVLAQAVRTYLPGTYDQQCGILGGDLQNHRLHVAGNVHIPHLISDNIRLHSYFTRKIWV